MQIGTVLTLLSASLATAYVLPRPATGASLPSVDLGYEIHKASSVNTTGSYYVFSNIPYAEQPVGDRRFKTPVLPTGSSSTVNSGGASPLACFQSAPTWELELEAAESGVSTSAILEELAAASGEETEGCLVLDVYVPEKVLNKGVGPAPVLVWIHGGGYVYGSKTADGVPAGLLARSTLQSGEGVIVVAINYRLGLFGWLADPSSVSTSAALTPNLGLYDQNVALEWVAKYISCFGGDAAQVTVMGQSAGGSSILHQIMAHGGAVSAPFQRAIMQSPAFQFNLNASASYELALQEASKLTGAAVTSVSALTQLDSTRLQNVNQAVTGAASLGFYNFGPVVDGTYVPETPQALLYAGRFNQAVQVMAAHNSFETGAFLTSVTTEAELNGLVAAALPKASEATLTYILDDLYPASAYSSVYNRAVQLSSELSFTCVTRHIAVALNGNTYNYYFNVAPGYHAEDVSYTFFNGDTTTPVDGHPVNATVARQLQDYLVGFAMTGDPDKSPAPNQGTPKFPLYTNKANVMGISTTGFDIETDNNANPRCTWWQKAMVKGLI